MLGTVTSTLSPGLDTDPSSVAILTQGRAARDPGMSEDTLEAGCPGIGVLPWLHVTRDAPNRPQWAG